jgi:hypothetical protein
MVAELAIWLLLVVVLLLLPSCLLGVSSRLARALVGERTFLAFVLNESDVL